MGHVEDICRIIDPGFVSFLVEETLKLLFAYWVATFLAIQQIRVVATPSRSRRILPGEL